MKKLLKNRLAIIIVSVILVIATGTGSLIYAAVADAQRTVKINTSSVIKEDFAGIGINSLPFTLMSNNLDKGANEAYFELEKSRILNLKPAIVRLWTQVDWFVTENDLTNGTGADYYSGVYNFESERMQSVYKYLDTYKQIGSQLILAINWKVASTIQPWFSIDGINNPETSAPQDIDAFAKAHVELLKYLINVKGYTNIKYISVANEPDLMDFESHGDQYIYYQDTSKKLADVISEASLDIELLGLESGAAYFTSQDFLFRSFKDNPDYFNEYAIHCYQGIKNATAYMRTVKNSLPTGKSIWLTEFNGNKFTNSSSGYMSIAANLGYNGALYWMVNDVYGEDPLNLNDENIGGSTGLWNKPKDNLNVKDSYYELSLWLRYVKPNSKVLESVVSNDEDMRSTVFFDGNDYTVIVENDTESAQTLTLNFDKNINKTFYKHIYVQEAAQPSAQAKIPASVKEFNVSNKLEDTDVVNDSRTVTVYTTIPDVAQVILENVSATVKSGESVKLNATATNGKTLTWSVVCGNGTVDQNGNYTASETTAGDIVAVKAETENGECAVAVISIE